MQILRNYLGGQGIPKGFWPKDLTVLQMYETTSWKGQVANVSKQMNGV